MAVASTSTSIPDLAQLRPPPLVSNDSQIEAQIRAKLTKKRKSRLRAFFSRDTAPNDPRSLDEEQDINETEPPLSEEAQGPIPEDAIQRGPVPAERTADIFQWARLFENQRGIYILGAPRYSSRTLLPLDPRPYTVPTAEPGQLGREAMNTPYNLQDFQLPDKNWKWIGEWSVEMYGDGQVSHDGFTYNWIFRNRGWSPKAQLITFVRRRSWVRLMMLPATSTPPISLSSQAQHRISIVASIKEGIWRGDEEDWERCHAALKLVDTDGKKLEMMRKWTGLKSEAVRRRIQWTEDAEPPSESQPDQPEYYTEEPLPMDESEPNLEFVLAVLADHYQEIAQSFKYPESRARFTEMLIQLGVHKRIPGGMISSGSGIDFWSRSNGLKDSELPAR